MNSERTWRIRFNRLFLMLVGYTKVKVLQHQIEPSMLRTSQIMGSKPNHFKKQRSSSSLLLTQGKNRCQKWQWSTQKASFLFEIRTWN